MHYLLSIYDEIEHERGLQRLRFDKEHDDALSPRQWEELVGHQLYRLGTGNELANRRRWLKIAALAAMAIAAIDRKLAKDRRELIAGLKMQAERDRLRDELEQAAADAEKALEESAP